MMLMLLPVLLMIMMVVLAGGQYCSGSAVVLPDVAYAPTGAPMIITIIGRTLKARTPWFTSRTAELTEWESCWQLGAAGGRKEHVRHLILFYLVVPARQWDKVLAAVA